MSYFSTELQRLLENMPSSRAGFASRAGIPASTFHNYFHGSTPPSVEDLEKICLILVDQERINLVVAHLRDQTPSCARDLIRVISLLEPSSVKEQSPDPYAEIKLPAAVLANLKKMARVAETSPAMCEFLETTVRLIEED